MTLPKELKEVLLLSFVTAGEGWTPSLIPPVDPNSSFCRQQQKLGWEDETTSKNYLILSVCKEKLLKPVFGQSHDFQHKICFAKSFFCSSLLSQPLPWASWSHSLEQGIQERAAPGHWSQAGMLGGLCLGDVKWITQVINGFFSTSDTKTMSLPSVFIVGTDQVGFGE